MHSGRTVLIRSPRRRMVATDDFSGLTSCAWALAKAAAIVPMVSLERCMRQARPRVCVKTPCRVAKSPTHHPLQNQATWLAP